MEDYSKLSVEDLLVLKKKLEYDVSKYDNAQAVRKTQLNSAYGVTGTQYFRFYNTQMAEAITLSGQMTIQWIAKQLNEYLNKVADTKNVDYIIASDTDSMYINVDNIVKKYCKETDKRKIANFVNDMSKNAIEPFIDSNLKKLATQLNVNENRILMAREVIADRGIWTAKKRYALNVWDSKGIRYDKAKQKIVGMETNRSSTPEIVRTELKKCLNIILTGTESELKREIKEFKQYFMTAELEKIAFPRSANNMEKYADSRTIYIKKTPIATKAALLYNHYIKEFNIDHKYMRIQEGEKIKFLLLKEENPFSGFEKNDSVMGFIRTVPKEFDIEKYVDRKMQFEKAFIDPINTIMQKVGWKFEETNTIEDLFS